MNYFEKVIVVITTFFCLSTATDASTVSRIETPPLGEQWFGIYLNGERVGFNRLRIEKTDTGYKIENDGSVRMKVMSFSKEASMRENYTVSKDLSLRTFDIYQTVNGSTSHLNGMVTSSSIHIKHTSGGNTSELKLKTKGDVYPGPALNIYPLMRPAKLGASFKVQLFEPEEQRLKEILITVLGDEKASDGTPAVRLRNTLYPFVTNDVWVDDKGKTIEESIREGLVTTKAESAKDISHFISNWALAKKDLIYDVSMIPVAPVITDPAKLSALSVEITGWDDSIPLIQGGGQLLEKKSAGSILAKTGTLVEADFEQKSETPKEEFLKPAEKIESEAREIVEQARQLADGKKNQQDLAKIIAAWTADWLKDTVEDGGSALTAYRSKTGNCQTHTRLYVALARAAGIPTRYVSGIVYSAANQAFLYHSWAESFIENRWISVDPTYAQLPADPTHIKFFVGHLPEDVSPIIAIIGKIRVNIVETKY